MSEQATKNTEHGKDKYKRIGVNENVKYVSNVDHTLCFTYQCKGRVTKNDLMGAIYNHGAGTVEDLTLEKLQAHRRLGRFEIDITSNEVGVVGEIKVPLIADRLEAAIVAANLETVSKCGPYTIIIKLLNIINEKQFLIHKILNTAKIIYETKFKEGVSTISQLRTLLKTQVADTKVVLLDASANIYAGPYHGNKQIYLVEGINDVKRLVECKIYNVVSINGAENNVNTLKTLLDGKELTAIFDNDYGGNLLLEQIGRELGLTYYVKFKF